MSSIQWKDVQGFEGAYQVSNTGQVKRLTGLDARGRKVHERLMKGRKNHVDYLMVTLSYGAKSKTVYVHRLVAEAFVPNPHPGVKIHVNHKDGNKQNNHAENLEWVSRSENQQHARRNGAYKNSPNLTGKRVLSDEQEQWIRDHYKKGCGEYGTLAMCRRFGVTNPLITRVLKGRR